MSSQEIESANRLQKDLLKKHEGKVLDDIFQGGICKTSNGFCYKIEESEKLKIKIINKNKAKSHILTDLKLIHGIGPSRACCLNEEGYATIEDLLEHPKYSKKAAEILDDLQESPLDCLTQHYSNSHPNLIYSSSFRQVDDFLFFDIETMGLKDLPVILIGMARIKDDQIKVTQYLATDLKDEKYMLQNFISHLNKETVFVSFNGRSFDLPFIKGRANYHGVHKKNLNLHHLDLLHLSRRTWGDDLPNCRLQTIEKHLFNMQRHEDVPSSKVPAFYKTYLKTGNIGPLVPIVEHNKQDVITLAKILSKLQEEIT